MNPVEFTRDEAAPKPHIFLVMTRGTGILTWWRRGILGRELALYRAYMRWGAGVTIVSLASRLDAWGGWLTRPARFLSRKRGEGDDAFSARVAAIVAGTPRAVVKTNQIPGADWAARMAERASVPIVVRCGYGHAFRSEQIHGAGSPEYKHALALEASVVNAASHVITTTPTIMAQLRRHRPDVPSTIIPNYVDTDLFNGRRRQPPRRPRVLSIGRLSEEKNYIALLDAVADLDLEVTLIGDGPQRANLERRARDHGVALRIVRRVPHTKLPRWHARASLYVQPSHYEGHPKALLEAMASGLPVIGSDVTGIRDVIEDGVTGVLGGPDCVGLRHAVMGLLSDPVRASELGKAAQTYVRRTCGLPVTFRKEAAILAELAGRT